MEARTMLRKSIRYAALTVVLITAIASLTMLLAPAGETHSPYLSALTSLAVSPAYAAGCPNKACNRGIDCVAGAGYKCIHFNGKGCTATSC
jgi:hypothetical protein